LTGPDVAVRIPALMIESREDLAFYLRADLVANGHDRFRAHFRVTQRIAYFQRLLRLTEFYENCSRTVLGRAWGQFLRLRLYRVGEGLGFTIPRNVFGPGLSIAHKGTIVVNKDVRVGKNCRIHQCVTIGGDDAQAPVIGDRVMISAGACILQDATVGDLAVIGANSVVTKAVRLASLSVAFRPRRSRTATRQITSRTGVL
jgi:serine O-acetyltransferase